MNSTKIAIPSIKKSFSCSIKKTNNCQLISFTFNLKSHMVSYGLNELRMLVKYKLHCKNTIL